MKKFLITILFIGALVVAGKYAYEPYIKPFIDDVLGGSEEGLADDSDEVADEETAPSKEVAKTPSPKTEPAKTVESSEPKSEPAAEGSKVDQAVAELYPMPQITPLMDIVENWKNVPKKAFPTEVTSREAVAINLVIDGKVIGSSKIAPGTPLVPVSLSGNQLMVASQSTSTSIDVDKTDFKARITKRYNDFVSKRKADVMAKRERAKKELLSRPEKLAAVTSDAKQASTEVSDPRLKPVQASLEAGDVASAKLEEVVSYTWNGEQTVRGDLAGTYDTVTVNFNVKTIFGTYPIRYKCLLKGGKVVGWIEPITENPL